MWKTHFLQSFCTLQIFSAGLMIVRGSFKMFQVLLKFQVSAHTGLKHGSLLDIPSGEENKDDKKAALEQALDEMASEWSFQQRDQLQIHRVHTSILRYYNILQPNISFQFISIYINLHLQKFCFWIWLGHHVLETWWPSQDDSTEIRCWPGTHGTTRWSPRFSTDADADDGQPTSNPSEIRGSRGSTHGQHGLDPSYLVENWDMIWLEHRNWGKISKLSLVVVTFVVLFCGTFNFWASSKRIGHRWFGMACWSPRSSFLVSKAKSASLAGPPGGNKDDDDDDSDDDSSEEGGVGPNPMMMLMMLKQMQSSIKQNMAKAPPEMQEQQKMLLQMWPGWTLDLSIRIFFCTNNSR